MTIEEHSILSGFGAAVAEVVVQNCPVPMKIMGIPTNQPYRGNQRGFAHYALVLKTCVRSRKAN